MMFSAFSNPAIMDGLFLSGGTVKNYVKSLKNSNFDLSFVPDRPNNSFNSDAFKDLGAISAQSRLVQTQITSMASLSASSGNAVERVQNFIVTFNSLKDKAANSGELNAQLSVLTVTFGRSLSFSGISMDSKGKLSITNESTLKSSIASGSFQKNFQGVNSFGDRINKISRDAYRTAYTSAVQANFSGLMKNTGFLFNGRA